MHAIGDGIDLVSREHQPRNFTMSFGDTVNVAAGIQGQVSHVEEKVRIREGSRLATRVPLPEYSKSHIRDKRCQKDPRAVREYGSAVEVRIDHGPRVRAYGL